MARRKGSKDLKPRKKPTRSASGKFVKTTAPAAPEPTTVERPALPPDDFAAAIAAEMGTTSSSPQSGPDPTPTADSVQGPIAFDPSSLTMDALASAWQLPFWLLGLGLTAFRVIPSPECVTDVGKRRAKDLAKPSYEIYRHHTTQYLGLNPENSVHVAAGVTALNGVGIVPELAEAIAEARRKWAAQRRMEQPTQGQGGPGPATNREIVSHT